MEQSIIEKTVTAFKRNHFDVYVAKNTQDAQNIFFQEIFPNLSIETVSWGDSETMKATGVLDKLKQNPDITVIPTFAPDMSRTQKIYWRAGSADCRFISHRQQCRHTKRAIGQLRHDWKPGRRNCFWSQTCRAVHWHQQNHCKPGRSHASRAYHCSSPQRNAPRRFSHSLP